MPEHIYTGEEFMSDFLYKSQVKMIYKILKADFDAGKSREEILADIADLVNDGPIRGLGSDGDVVNLTRKLAMLNEENNKLRNEVARLQTSGSAKQNNLSLPALNARIVFDGDSVSVISSDDMVVQVSAEEWEMLRGELRLNTAVDYEAGETPMTVYQFRSFVEVTRKLRNLEAEKARLGAEAERLKAEIPGE